MFLVADETAKPQRAKELFVTLIVVLILILQLIQIARFAFVYCRVAEHWIIFFLGEGASVDRLPAVAIRLP